jgi:hypothetical protein
MRARWWLIWLTVSVVLNGVLLVAWLRELRPVPSPAREVVRRPVVTNLLRPIRTNLVLQPRFLNWQDLESEDYPTYIRNLRGIGCPPETIRDIIVADVGAWFERRRPAEVPSLRQQWWRRQPDAELVAQVQARQAALEAERHQLLTTLLGPGWEAGLASAAGGIPDSELDGPVLGSLSTEARRQVHDIERRGRERLAALTEDAKAVGAAASEAEEVRVRRAIRAELAAVLDPEQLEEYLLRTSPTAERLREQFDGVEPTPDQFRQLFRAADAFEAHLAEVGEGTDPASERRRAALAVELEQTFERELGTARYLRHRLSQDQVFQQTYAAAERAGVAAEKLLPLYQVNQVASEERSRVLADPSLAPEEQTRRLAELYEQRLAALRTLLGEEAFRKLQAEERP